MSHISPLLFPMTFHIFFFPVLSSLKIIAIRYELSTRVDRRGKERRGNGRWEGKGKARRTMNARLCISTSTSMARIMHLTEVSIGSRFLPFISFYIVLLVSSTDTSTFTYPRGRVWPASRSSEYRFRLFFASLLSNRAALQFFNRISSVFLSERENLENPPTFSPIDTNKQIIVYLKLNYSYRIKKDHELIIRSDLQYNCN